MPDKLPNILFITDDEHHAGCLGHADRPQVRTPNLDRLAREGVVFPRSYSVASECIPSRISMLTGMYVHSHGVYIGNVEVPGPPPSLPRCLSDQLGYRTAIIGKKHYARWAKDPFETDTGEAVYGYTREYLESLGLREKFKEEYFNYIADFWCYTSQIPHEHSQTAYVTRQTIDKIDELGEQPFLIWSNFGPPHPPYRNSFDSPHLYNPDEIDLSQIPHRDPEDLRSFNLRPGSARMGVENSWRMEVAGEAKYREALAHYYGMCTTVDDEVGKMLRHLEERGILENTIVIFNSDHGDFAGEYNMLGKNTIGQCECIQRVPTLWYWKGHFGPERIESFVENIDIFPTLCELVGLDIPYTVQGESYADALRFSASGPGPAPATKEMVFWDNCSIKSVRTRRFRLSYPCHAQGGGELFDYRDDPEERINRFDDRAYADVKQDLMGELLDWTMRTEQPHGWDTGRGDGIPSRWYQEHPYAQQVSEPNLGRLRPDHDRGWD